MLDAAFLLITGGLLAMLLPWPKIRGLALIGLGMAALGAVYLGFPARIVGLGDQPESYARYMQNNGYAALIGLGFGIALLCGLIFAWHETRRAQQLAILIYAGAAFGAVATSNPIALFAFWEITAIASVFLIWGRGGAEAAASGMRYLLWQVGSGVLLLAGILFTSWDGVWPASPLHIFEAEALVSTPGGLLLLAGIGIKLAFPFVNTWLTDGYARATPVGAVILSIFTTKMALIVLLRLFPGTEALIYIGALMALLPMLHALVVDDMRQVLAYALVQQLGLMVMAVGIGSELAIAGAVSHAVASILYKALLFMAMGAVLYRVGTTRASELGGLWRHMPFTAAMTLVGAAAISGLPLLSGFTTKALSMSAAGKAHLEWVWIVMYIASVGAVLHTGLRLPYMVFFGAERAAGYAGVKDAPFSMKLGMGLLALACFAIGLFPQSLYALLPVEISYEPYTLAHLSKQLQLILAAALVFVLMRGLRMIQRPKTAVSHYDVDWLWRVAGLSVVMAIGRVLGRIMAAWERLLSFSAGRFLAALIHANGPEGRLARVWPTGYMVIWVAVLLGITLLLTLFDF